jgi:EmrB/QacA subfamily drug resistance transporter
MTTQTTAASPAPYAKRWKALIVLGLSLLLISLDNTILNTALPSLRDDLGASASELQWIVDAYLLVFAGLLLTAGSLGDRFGRKRALQFGLSVFALGSIGSALAGDTATLIASRALMGVGGAFIMPSTLSIITAIFPADERPKAIAAWAAVSGIGIILGPLAGGALLEFFSWSSVFWVNVPIVVVALIAGSRLIPESRDAESRALDPLGAALSIAGLGVIVWSIIEAPEAGWSDPSILVGLGLGAVLTAAFVAWERRTPQPMLELALFRNRRFTAASASISLVFAALLGIVFVLTQYLQSVLGHDALGAGLRITPLGLGVIVASAASAQITARRGAKLPVVAGLTAIAAAMAVLSTVTVDSGYGLVALSLVLMGGGIGLAMAPATDAIMGAVSIDHASVGSAMNDTTRLVGGVFGVAIIGSVLSGGYSGPAGDAAVGLPAGAAEAAESSIGGAAALAAGLPAPAADSLMNAANAAFVSGMSSAALVAGGFAAVGALVAALWLPASAADAPESQDAPAQTAVPVVANGGAA